MDPNESEPQPVAEPDIWGPKMMKKLTLMLLCLIFPMSCIGQIDEEGDNFALFYVYLEQGTVSVMSRRDLFECQYTPTMCGGPRVGLFTVKTTSHVDRVDGIGSFEARKEYNEFDTPRADTCDLPPGSIYLAIFLPPPASLSSSSSSSSEPTIIIEDDTRPVLENYDFIRLPADAVEQSPYAQEAREFMYWAMEECEKKGAPNWRN